LGSSWFISNSSRFDSVKELKDCLTLGKQIIGLQEDIREEQDKLETLESDIERVRENLKVVASDTGSSVRTNWINELNTSEAEIKKINKTTMPALIKQRKQLEQQLQEKLAEVTVVCKTK